MQKKIEIGVLQLIYWPNCGFTLLPTACRLPTANFGQLPTAFRKPGKMACIVKNMSDPKKGHYF